MRVTLQDIAQAAGLSASTVSRALRGYGDISEETRKKVLEISARLGYTVPSGWNTAAMKRKRDQLLVLSSNSHQPSATHDLVLSGVRDFVTEVGISLNLLDLAGDLTNQTLDMLKSQQLGVLFIMPTTTHPIMARCRSHGIPVAVANRSADMLAPQPIDIAVHANERKVAELIVKYLIDKGHTAIAFVATDPNNCMMRIRTLMMKDALTEAGLPVRNDWLLFEAQAPEKYLVQMFRAAEPPTALVCASDNAAFRSIRVLSEAGLHVPGDVSVIGVHDLPISKLFTPSLTTVHIPLRQIGYETAKQVYYWHPGNENICIDVVFQPHLVERASVRSI
ncbi:MAG TPA: LacI family transcriptional regulator [Firmicutes bacterium]|nr:LacI family transcriptional regulator [Bacillota bacterium]